MTDALAKECAAAIHIIAPDGRIVARAGRAGLMLIADLGFPRIARLLARRPFVWAVERGYEWVALNRPAVARWIFTEEYD
jgi:hypothetical protein